MYISMNIGRSLTEEPDLKNRLLYKTLELELKSGGGLQVVKNSFNDTENVEKFDSRKRYPLIPKDISQGSLRDDEAYSQHKTKQLGLTQKFQQTMNITQRILDDEDINDHGHNGVLSSLVKEHQKKHEYLEQLKSEISDNLENPKQPEMKTFNNLKLMVCITMFKEPLTQLQKSIDGVVQSLDAFLGQGIAPHQIGVTVFFDGIENVHNVIDENGSSYHDNIISYFKGHLDDEYGIKGKKTLEYQYWEYKKHKKRMHDYSPQNIINMQRNRELLLKKYKKYKASLLQTMKANKNGIWMPQDEWIESHIIDAMIHQYHLSKKYIDERQNSAWVYQGRYMHKGCTMPIFYVFKFTNGSKLSSHMWFFKGFCQELQPDYCLLMDCGAIPGKDSIFKLIMAMEADPKLGGVCGNMRIEEEKESDKQNQPMDILSRVLNQNFFSIQKCQSCEYDIGHILDKQYESSLNYIHVLPGAFSAYRYLAFTQQYVENSDHLQKIKLALHKWQENMQDYESQYQSQFLLKNEKRSTQENILDSYLRQVMDKSYEYSSIKEANMFLAEDRVLCQLLFCNNYYLRYIPDAVVYVDACLSLVDLLFQRRRWINGSWFALEYVADTYHEKLQNCKHSNWDKMLFRFSIVIARIGQLQQYFFQTLQIVWLYMILQVAIGDSMDDPQNLVQETAGNIIVSAIMALYIFLIMTLIYLSITYNASILNNTKGSSEKDKQKKQEQIKEYYYSKYYSISTILGLISLATLAYTFYLLIDQIIINQYFTQFIVAPDVPQSYYYLLLVISCGILASPFLLTLFTSLSTVLSVGINSIHYFYYQPTYTHLFITYSFCRIDDLSWGTKGLTEDNEQRKLNTDKQYKKFLFITKWIVTNCIASGILILFLRMKVFLLPQCLILIVSVILTVISILKGFLAIVYHCKFYSPLGGYKAQRDKIITKQQCDSTLTRGKDFNLKLTTYFSAKASIKNNP